MKKKEEVKEERLLAMKLKPFHRESFYLTGTPFIEKAVILLYFFERSTAFCNHHDIVQNDNTALWQCWTEVSTFGVSV